jgi:hypothetical protein
MVVDVVLQVRRDVKGRSVSEFSVRSIVDAIFQNTNER